MIEEILKLGFVETPEPFCVAKVFQRQHEVKNWIWEISFIEKENYMIVTLITSGDKDIYFKGIINNVEDFNTIIRILEI